MKLKVSLLGVLFGTVPLALYPQTTGATLLHVAGDLDLEGNLLIDGGLFMHSGSRVISGDTAVGLDALRASHDTTGWLYSYNTALGSAALTSCEDGIYNTAVGHGTLSRMVADSWNTAVGAQAMEFSRAGSHNTAIGVGVLNHNAGSHNTAIGAGAFFNLNLFRFEGSRNIAVGAAAGARLHAGNDNIYVGSLGESLVESNTIRLGTPYDDNQTPDDPSDDYGQNATFIAGIAGQLVDPATGVAVKVDASGKLGTTLSSRRYKSEIRDMEGASAAALDLRPVTFRYKSNDGRLGDVREYGLIAEEVAEIFPDLVVFDDRGRPQTVKYGLLITVLLNELQRLHTKVTDLERQVLARESDRDGHGH